MGDNDGQMKTTINNPNYGLPLHQVHHGNDVQLSDQATDTALNMDTEFLTEYVFACLL